MRHRRLLGAVAAAAVLAGCGSSDRSPATSSPATSSVRAEGYRAQVASYDLSVGRDLRFIAGVLAEGGSKLVSFGSLDFSFAYLGTRDAPLGQPRPGPRGAAEFRPIPGQRLEGDTTRPRVVEGSQGIGVYAVDGIRFDAAGLWRLSVTGTVGAEALALTSDFEVRDTPAVPVTGEAAPRSENHLPGAAGVPPKAVDSRAGADGGVPDPALHAQTVAAAIASGRPTMVVVSTPVYCQSRFCGPITDSVQALADHYGQRMGFVHLEVWRDFEAETINQAAAEWIYRSPTDGIYEPWVFVVAGDGTIVARFDNVASDAELQGAVETALA